MSLRRAHLLRLALVVGIGGARGAAAQGWSADLYAGGTRAQGIAAQVTSTSLVGNVRYLGLRGSGAYLSVGAPLDDSAAVWAAAGLSSHHEKAWGPVRVGIDAAADAFGFRDRGLEQNGGAVAAHVLPFLGVSLPAGAAVAGAELRGGMHAVEPEKNVTGRPVHVWELGGRGTLNGGSLAAAADVRWLRGDSATYPYAGAQLSRAFEHGAVWGAAGRWLGDLRQTTWEVGATLSAGGWGDLWASVRQDATDPLWGNPPRRSWNVGFSRALGRRSEPLPAPVVSSGRARITLGEKTVPRTAPAGVRVAGEFNGWTPQPMTRAGGEWVLELPLARGVYRFAFVTASGEWFVPEGFPGRIDDGMGGHVAVLVIP